MPSLKSFLKDSFGITGLQVVNVYSFSLILPKGWVDYCTEEVEVEGKVQRFVKVEALDDTLVIRGVSREELDVVLATVKRKGTE